MAEERRQQRQPNSEVQRSPACVPSMTVVAGCIQGEAVKYKGCRVRFACRKRLGEEEKDFGGGKKNMAARVGCEHYARSCLLKAPCCGKLYVCRLCHDAEEKHQMDRFKVKEVQCSECQTLQQAQQVCQQCHVQFGEYYCDICHLFDKDKKQYHCHPCGICRIGPQEKYFHCDKCNLCLAQDLQGNHKCVEDVSRQNCPVCMEDIHTSRIGAHVLPCGHLLHKSCFDDMVRTSVFRCPLCMHSVWNMKAHWDQIDIEIAQSPMPTEYQGTTVKIMCNDCQTHCTVPFHVLGMKCTGCGSYNTAQDGGLIQQPQQQHPEPDNDNVTETNAEQQHDQAETAMPH